MQRVPNRRNQPGGLGAGHVQGEVGEVDRYSWVLCLRDFECCVDRELRAFRAHACEVHRLGPSLVLNRARVLVAYRCRRRGEEAPCPQRFNPEWVLEPAEKLPALGWGGDERHGALDLLRSW